MLKEVPGWLGVLMGDTQFITDPNNGILRIMPTWASCICASCLILSSTCFILEDRRFPIFSKN